MKIKKIKKKERKFILRVLMLASIWVLSICIFVAFAFSFEMKQAANLYSVKTASGIKIAESSEEIENSQRINKESRFRELIDKADKHIRENLVSIAKENNAGDDKTVAEEINFIAENRALVFYRSDGKDRYLAEVVFGEDNGQIKINRFILKIKNDIDYSGGVYGAD